MGILPGEALAGRTHQIGSADNRAGVLSVDITVCPRCGGTMRLVAALTDPHSIRTYLTGVGLPADPPTISPARPPPQQQLDFAA